MKNKYSIFYSILKLFLFFFIVRNNSVSQTDDIKILESNQNRLVISFTPKYKETVKLNSGIEIYDVLDFNNSIPSSAFGKNFGSPDIPFRSFTIGLPSLLNNKVEIIKEEFENIKDINIKPVPDIIKSNDSIGTKLIYEKNQAFYNKSKLYPENLISLYKPGIARDQILANIIVYPLQYNPLTKELKKYKNLIIQVTFGNQNPKGINRIASIPDSKSDLLGNIVINYSEAKNWKVADNNKNYLTTVQNSVLATGEWVKVEVTDEGIYKIPYSSLKNAGMNVSSIDPKTIKVYGNGGYETPEDLTITRPNDLLECAIYVSNESSGSFKDGDYILFYGKGISGWKYNPGSSKYPYFHYLNLFSKSNYYFITYGGTNGKRFSSVSSLNSTNPYKPTSIMGKYYFEPEQENALSSRNGYGSGREWFGFMLSGQTPTRTYASVKIDGVDQSKPIFYRIECLGRSEAFNDLKLEQNSQTIGTVSVFPVGSLNSDSGDYGNLKVDSFSVRTDIKDSKFNFKITYYPNDYNADAGYLSWIEAFYSRSLSTTTDEIVFDTYDTNAVVEYSFENFSSSNIVILNVTDHNNVKSISNASISGGNVKFQVQAKKLDPGAFYVVGEKGFKDPATIVKIKNQNMHGISDGAEFIIITCTDFLTEAERYRSYRDTCKINPFKTKVFDVANIYNEFSGGLQDPTGIRDFIKYAYDNWQIKPKYVLLFGDGNYDYKGNDRTISLDKNKVPPYETLNSLNPIESYCTDDFYVRFVGNDNRNDLSIGRITASTQTEAQDAVNKIIYYESDQVYDSWRNTLTFVADDGYTGTGDDGATYTNQSEEILENLCPATFEKKKIYIVAYKTVFGYAGRTKPDANKAIIDQFNSGTLIVNYIGHGSPRVWAHETIFDRTITPPQMYNKTKLPFLVAATCDFGRYDDGHAVSGTEILQLKSDGGIISAFSTSRSVYASENYSISRSFYRSLFDKDKDMYLPRTSDVIYGLKQSFIYTNDDKFHLIGDPTLRLNSPRYGAKIDSINANPTYNETQLKALSKVTLKGSILKDQSTVWKDYVGNILITIYDASKSVTIEEGIGTFVFRQEGGFLYKGESTVKNGEFSSTFIIPKDISYENNNGKIGLYFQNGGIDGSGSETNIKIGGTDTNSVTDKKGPIINLYLNDRNFHDGDLVNENPKLLVDLFDESGINVSSIGIGHRFEAYFDKESTPITLDNYYQGKIDSYQEGSAEYDGLKNLSEGMHKVKVNAFDIYNNISTKEVSFKVNSSSQLSVQNVMNFPNPFKNSTKFTFQQNQDSPIDVTIKIFTVAGRLIKTVREYGITDKFVQVFWDGRDEEGDGLANGVYLYKVITMTQDGRVSNESIGKLSIIR